MSNEHDRFKINTGPGTIVGAMAVGSGAKAEGHVSVGGAAPRLPDRLRCRVDIRNASASRIAAWLRDLAEQLEDDKAGTFAATKRSGAAVAWTVQAESADPAKATEACAREKAAVRQALAGLAPDVRVAVLVELLGEAMIEEAER
jgi:hypothetical protein